MPSLRVKNSYTNQLETFQPLDAAGKRVTMYVCGPTVYSFAHIGNFRSFLLGDLLRRVLEREGYEVRQVMNITDVGHMTEDHIADAEGEDKLAKAARELGSDPYSVAGHFENAFIEDAKTLRLRNYQPDEAEQRELHPQATRHVPHMLAMVQRLLERDFAYLDDDGQVYFEISKFPEYGKLSGKDIDELQDGARVAVRSGKRDPRDFALWKVDGKHLMQWDPHSAEGWPEGDYELFKGLCPDGVDERIKKGFPGWHIECSAMSQAHLGDAIDFHTGGEDNIFPHHECEIAQCYGAEGGTVPAPDGAGDAGEPRKTFARYWVHGRHLLVDNRKMSKRDGTFFTVRDLFDPVAAERPELVPQLKEVGFADGSVPANVLRYALLSNQYTQPMNFSFDVLNQSRSGVERLQSLHDRLRELAGDADAAGASAQVTELVAKSDAAFGEALCDNLNMPNALAAVFGFVRETNAAEFDGADAAAALAFLYRIDEILDVLDLRVRTGVIASDRIAALIEQGGLPTGDELAGADSVDTDRIELFAAQRQASRKQKDYAQADQIRDELKRLGIAIEDIPAGVRWKLV